ncbi:hypothetical protein [Pseudomonas oryzihabitans]|uniref:hypothetical protein n=1 Tax=Pseudomonas oryzihabitans TaxID=47885 RepID=UPI003F96F002
MPPKDRHGKTAQDYRAALIAELDAVPDYHRRRKAQCSPLLFVWLLVPVALLWLNWPGVQHWLHPAPVVEPSAQVTESQTPAPPPAPSAPAPRQAIAAPQPLDACLKQGNVVDEEVLRCRYGAVPRAQEPASAAQGMVSTAYLAQYKAKRPSSYAYLFFTLLQRSLSDSYMGRQRLLTGQLGYALQPD